MPSEFVADVHAPAEAGDTPTSLVRQAADAVFYGLSSAADHGLLWFALGSVRAARKGDPAIALRLGVALGVESAFTNGVVKSFFNARRPPDHFTHDEPLPYGMHRPITGSFPSGHAACAFMAASLLSQDTDDAPAWFALAALVAMSRVYVKMHHRRDVVAGAALGLALGAIGRRVIPLSGASRRR